MPGERDPLSVLVVCDANVCRSPVAQLVLSTILPGVRVESVGVHSARPMTMCAVARRELALEQRTQDDVDRFARTFMSRPLSAVSLDDFQLVLTATRMLRGDLVGSRPDARDRIFTLREASILLLAGDTADGELDDSVGPGGSEDADLVNSLNRRRGSTPLPERVRRPFSRPTHPFDIPDGHGSHTRRHRSTIGEIVSAATSVGAELRSWSGR